MTKEQQRIKIAEACGWTRLFQAYGDLYGDKEKPQQRVPNYPEDLNACHEMEQWLKGTLEQYHNDPVIHRRWKEYQYLLMKRFGASATAAQRCEYFLRVLNLWEERP